MSAKITASADGTKVNIGNAAEDALQIDATAKTIKPVAPYQMAGNGPAFTAVSSGVGTTTGSLLLQISEETDSDNCYSAGRFTPNKPGWYVVTASIQYQMASGTVTYYGLIIKKNTTAVATAYQPAYASLYGGPACSALVYMNGTTDYIEVWQDISVTGSPTIGNTRSGASMVRGA